MQQESGQSSPVVQADTGLGTTYERWALNRLLTRLHAINNIRTVLEAPGDGMTGISGINSLILGLRGARVSLLLPGVEHAELAKKVWAYHAPEASLNVYDAWDGERLPFRRGIFDLAWNFNVMTRHPDPLALLYEMARVSRKYVLICLPNRFNYAFWLHRLHHRVAGQPWDHGSIDLMQSKPWLQMMRETGLHVRRIYWLDCPWWPDIVDPTEMIKDFFPFVKRFAGRARSENRYCWHYKELPYYRPATYSDVHQRMARLAYFENSSRTWLKRRFAHHIAIFAEKG